MITPPFLKKNDRVAMVAPAGRIAEEKVIKAAETLKNWGFEVILGKHLFQNHFNFASTDEKRLADFQHMLDDPSIRAIICARGGYGTNRIIDQLDFSKFTQHPKWIIGFSDITVLHNHIQRHCGIETIHGTMAAGLTEQKNNAESIQTLRTVLTGGPLSYETGHDPLSRKGNAKGVLTGGNLAILCSLLGTSSEIDTRGKILFLEEVGEHLYKIDRMMVQLRRAGKLSQLAGMLVGGFDDLPDDPSEFGKTAFEIISDATEKYEYPVSFGFPAGHRSDNRTLILGRKIKLEVSDKTRLFF